MLGSVWVVGVALVGIICRLYSQRRDDTPSAVMFLQIPIGVWWVRTWVCTSMHVYAYACISE